MTETMERRQYAPLRIKKLPVWREKPFIFYYIIKSEKNQISGEKISRKKRRTGSTSQESGMLKKEGKIGRSRRKKLFY